MTLIRQEIWELLQRGRRALAERLQAYGDFAYPASGTLSMAWQVLRSAMAEDGYYFSVHELQVLMAVHNVRVEAYDFKRGVDDSASLEPLTPEWLDGTDSRYNSACRA